VRLARLQRRLGRALGWKARLLGPLLGPFVFAAMWREQGRADRGVCHEPPTFYEANRPEAFAAGGGRGPTQARWL
jgi:hypothetical protein